MTANERRPEWRVKYARRLFAVFCCGVLVLGMMEPPKAKAVAIVDDAFLITAAFMAACGLSWSLTNSDRTGFTKMVSDSVGQYLDTVGGDIVEWSAAIAGAATLGVNGKLKLTKLAAEKLGAFTNWLIQKLGITAGGTFRVTSNMSIPLYNGTSLHLTQIPISLDSDGKGYMDFSPSAIGDIFYKDDVEANSVVLQFTESYYWTCGWLSVTPSDGGDKIYSDSSPSSDYIGLTPVFYHITRNGSSSNKVTMAVIMSDGKIRMRYNSGALLSRLGVSSTDESTASISAATAIDVPDTSTMADDDAIALDIGAAVGTALEDALAQIWEKIQSGTLEATKEVVKEQEDTEPEEVTDVNQLGLPALGAALQTRFPFSIPWDFVAAVKLLAAPPVTPKWTVDILKPVQARYGIFNGDTSITIDLGEYPLIGQVSRWISTFFFGVGLMMATKKLVWAS